MHDPLDILAFRDPIRYKDEMIIKNIIGLLINYSMHVSWLGENTQKI